MAVPIDTAKSVLLDLSNLPPDVLAASDASSLADWMRQMEAKAPGAVNSPARQLLRWIIDQIEAQAPVVVEPGTYSIVEATCSHLPYRVWWAKKDGGWYVIGEEHKGGHQWASLRDAVVLNNEP